LRRQHRQGGGSGSRQSQTDQRRTDANIVYLRVPAIPVFNLQALRQVAHHALTHERSAAVVQAGLVLQ
jgi:hypothetical protein